jgi:hypothetical protein
VGQGGVRWLEAFTEAPRQARTEELSSGSDRGSGEQHRPALPQVQRSSGTHAWPSLQGVPAMTEMRPAKYIDGHWYLPVEDFHEVRQIAAKAIALLDADYWTPEQRDELQDAYAKATSIQRAISRMAS